MRQLGLCRCLKAKSSPPEATCHKRIQQIFSELECDVRDLPVRTGVAKRVEPEAPMNREPIATVPTVAAVEPQASTRELDLPVYDAESWDEAVEILPRTAGAPDWSKALAKGVIAPRPGIEATAEDQDARSRPVSPVTSGHAR